MYFDPDPQNLKDIFKGIIRNPNYYPLIGAGLGYLSGTALDYGMQRSDQPFYMKALPMHLLGAGTGAAAGYGAKKITEKMSAYTAMEFLASSILENQGS
jgi:hypothetical protein